MDLQSGRLYWPTTIADADRRTYVPLGQDITCDVLVVGAGSSGAQCALRLADSGLRVVVVDKRRAGEGSTSTNTALIQYAGDKTYVSLINTFGEAYATRHLKLCEQAISELEQLCGQLPGRADFQRRNSLYCASCPEDVPQLELEYAALRRNGFKVDYWQEEQIRQRYPFSRPAALYYLDDAELNPLAFNLGGLELAYQKGVQIFEQTEITGREQLEAELTLLRTNRRHNITARWVIYACGYEGLELRTDRNAVLSSSYAMVTTPVADFSVWPDRTLIWESARPYIYMRTTADNRVIVGGLDETTSIAEQRDSKLPHKRRLLLDAFHALFPSIAVEPAFDIAAFYGGTHDGLPMIGHDEARFPRTFFLYGYGDNGLVYSTVLSKLIAEHIVNGSSADSALYLHNRPLLQHAYQL